jgi:hypothetical protein
VIPEARQAYVGANLGRPFVLIDGLVSGWWRIERSRDGLRLVVQPFERLGAKERAPLEAEGAALLDFAAVEGRPARAIAFEPLDEAAPSLGGSADS